MDTEVISALAEFDRIRGNLGSGTLDDAETLKDLRSASWKLSHALEEPKDRVDRVCYQYMESASVRIALDLDLFNILVRGDKPQSCDELAKKTGADPALLARILRSLGATGAVGELNVANEDVYIATKMSKAFVVPHMAAGVEFIFDYCSKSWHSLPGYLRERNFKNPTNPVDTAFNCAYGIKEHFIQSLVSKPDTQRKFQLYLSGLDADSLSWMEFYPVNDRIGTHIVDPGPQLLFVDIGGGVGHQAIGFRRRFPDLSGRVVLQDLPHVAAEVKSDQIEVMAYDMFTPQPLKGAQVYFLRNILHDWNDEVCHIILSRIRAAMDPAYSKVLINQWVLPTQHVTPFKAHQDLNMMALFSATERTESQYRELLDRAGLKIMGIYNPPDGISEGIIEAIVK